MKIKNKFVLLIIMSLFLLISIGSVCASDNITDQAIQTYDENSEVSSIESEIADVLIVLISIANAPVPMSLLIIM